MEIFLYSSYQLKNNPTNKFVDFQNYKISGDPAAFFVEPHIKDSEIVGWFVLQFSITKINDMFSVEEALGQTGEVFLVNKDCYMLTDSRFFADSTRDLRVVYFKDIFEFLATNNTKITSKRLIDFDD